MTKNPDPNSKRSKRRANRVKGNPNANPFTKSRNNRRAEERQKSLEKGYEIAVAAASTNGVGYTKPGAMRRW